MIFLAELAFKSDRLLGERRIIARYKTKQSRVEEASIGMYLAGVSVRRGEDITETLWNTKSVPVR